MNTNDSDPLMSPNVLPAHPYSSRESATMETRMEEEMDSDTEVHAAELVRRGSAQLINQMSPPARSPYHEKRLLPHLTLTRTHGKTQVGHRALSQVPAWRVAASRDG